MLQATAPGLESKLGNLAPAYAVAGNIASYFVERFVLSVFVSPFECKQTQIEFVACMIQIHALLKK